MSDKKYNMPEMPEALTTVDEKLRWLTEQLQAEINSLNYLSYQLDEAQKRYMTRTSMHEDDITFISEALLSEADARGWCSDYDTFVKALNSKLNLPLTERCREFEVTATYTITLTKMIDASSEDDAREQFENEFELSEDDIDSECDVDVKPYDIEVSES